MTSRHIPNEHERQPRKQKSFHNRLQTIMEADSNANRSPGERQKKQQSERGVKRPFLEMAGQTTLNTDKSNRQPIISTQSGRSIVADGLVGSCASQPAKRPVLQKTCCLTTDANVSQKRPRAGCLAACQADPQKRKMRSSQVAPSGCGVPKLIRNQIKPIADDQRAMHKQLQIEHLQLQRSFALWRQLVEEARSHKDNEELASWAEEKEGILRSTKKLQNKVEELQEKLNEYREQNELLEFRILELDHCQTKQSQVCGEVMTSRETQFCTTGCSQPEDPCFRLFQDQVNLYQKLQFRADELLEELRLLSAQPGLNCTQRTALARSAACVCRCRGEVMSAIGDLPAQPARSDDRQLEQTTENQILFGRKDLSSVENASTDDDEAELSDQCLLQETSMTESEIGQALISEWPVTLSEPHHKSPEQHHSEDEGLGEDSRRSTELHSLGSDDSESKSLQTLVEDLRRKNSSLSMELRQAELLVRTLKSQADRVQELEDQLTRTEREKSEYQEQILELEEAENDARLESQTLRVLVDNLRQHENDLEKSLSATRDKLEECEHRALKAGTTAEELRSQVGYLEELVYKYEEHIEGLERAESELQMKLLEVKKECTDVEVQVTEIKKDFTDVSVQVQCETVQCKCPQKSDLLARLQSLEEKDGVLREQLHQVDGINLKLWQKLYCLETDIGECKRQESSWGPEQHHREAAARLEDLLWTPNSSKISDTEVLDSEGEISERLQMLERNEKKLREQLQQLEQINLDFERELEVREKLNRDKEHEQCQWLERERELKVSIKELEMERVCLREQTMKLEEERVRLKDTLEQLQEEYGRLKLAHCQETQDLHSRHQEASQGMQGTGGHEGNQKVMRLSQEALQLKSEQEELRTQVAEMSLAFETELRALRACHELEEKRLHDEMVTLRCRDDQCCSRVQELAAQRERLEVVLGEREQQLEMLTAEYQTRFDTLEEERKLVEQELQRKMTEMEDSTANAVQEFEEKRKQLETSLRADMEDLRCKENNYKVRIRELERHVDYLRNEITSLAQGVGSEEYPSEEDMEYRRRIEDLEKKEAAYVETLQNADKIISQMELRYRDNIQRLEGSEKSLQERIVQLEMTESELRCALNNEKHTSDSNRMTDLVRELMDAEVRENSLKEHADELEASRKSLLQKVRELEKKNQKITEELHEHEETAITAEDLRREQENLKEEISQLKRSESALKETLAHADTILAQREHILALRVSELEVEKQGLGEMVSQLREHVRTLQEQLDQAQFHELTSYSPPKTATDACTEDLHDLKLESMSATQAQLGDLDDVKRNQEKVIEHLEESKTSVEQRFDQLQSIIKGKDCDVNAGKELQKRVMELETLIRRSSWSSGQTKETQTDRSFYCNSRSATAPVSPASSLEDLARYSKDVQKEKARGEELEDASCLGMEERLELEQCMTRAMAAMERDLQRKSEQQKPQRQVLLSQVFHHKDEEEDEDGEEEEERIRMPPSPAYSSTSGCESDCSSNGGSCQWPVPAALSPLSGKGKALPEQSDCYGSEEENGFSPSQVERLTVTSRELPTLLKTRIIYPSITKAEVKKMPTLITRHSECSMDDSTTEGDRCLPDPPGDFCILRRVGQDSLLLGWTPPKSSVNSYEILVEGEVQQRVRSPDRTKALLHKLDLTRPLTVGIRSIVNGTQPELVSRAALLRFEPTECQN